MTGPDQQLAAQQRAVQELGALRAEIDAVDSQLHDLLMRRTELAVKVGEVKAKVQPLGGTPADGAKFIRPAREALILRRLVARHQGKLPKAVILRMWREMISALLQVEGPFVVAVQAPKGDTALWDLARDHYGSRVRITPLADTKAVLAAVNKGKATVGILPMPAAGERAPWWPALDEAGGKTPHVMGRLPFGDIGNVRDPKAEAIVIGRAPNEPTGFRGAPFFAINGHLRQELNYSGNLVVETGWCWVADENARLLRIGLIYFNGHSNQFSFYANYEQQIGMAVWYDF